MKRSNRFVIGTVLFLLVAALVFIQSRNSGSDEDGHEHDAPAAATPDNAPPTVDDLQREIGGGGSAGGPVLPKKSERGP